MPGKTKIKMEVELFAKKRHFAPQDHVVRLFLPIIPKRLRPNHLTLIRLIFTPVLVAWLMLEFYLPSFFLFIILALTDMFDGSIARLRDQVTDWGKIWDPVADKLLIGSVVFVLLLQVNFSLALLIIGFEVAFIAAGTLKKMLVKDVVIQANIWGKIKMNLQCFGGGFLILGFFLMSPIFIVIAQTLFYIALFFAAVSLLSNGI